MGKLDARRERRMARDSMFSNTNVGGESRRVDPRVTAILDKVKTMSDKTKVTISALREMYPQNRAVNQALDEISRIAAMLELDVSRWNIIKLFGVANPGYGDGPIMTDPVAIERIVREKGRRPLSETTDDTLVNDETVQAIANVYTSAARAKITKQLDELEDAAAFSERTVNDLLGNVWRTISELSKYTIQIATLKGQLDPNKSDTDRIREQLRQLEMAGFWTDFRIEKSCLWARTANPVVVSEVNILAGIDRHVNCGYYAARLAPAQGTVSVHACGGNRLSENKGSFQIHPHVYADGKICLGEEGSQRFIAAVRNMSIGGMLVAVQSALCGYDNGSTYVPLDMFEAAPTFAAQVSKNFVCWTSPYGDIVGENKRDKPKTAADTGKLAEPDRPAAGEGEAVRL